ncbi:MAG: polyphosphate kinase 2 family protein [Methyloceanibacter sp.]
MLPSDLIERFRISIGSGFHLQDIDPGETCGLDKERAKTMLESCVARLSALQERLYADGHWAVLVVLQGMDTSGKDGVIEHVMSGINPQGCEVHSFKAPSEQELAHDFLWRTAMALPARGHIGVFNRSYYEETIVVRVHPSLLERQRLPQKLFTDDIWKGRFEDISNFEHHLARNGVVPLKFFLHISREEQLKRLVARIDDPDKRWKFSLGDVEERNLWDKYHHAYEETIRNTSTSYAPWYVVPANHKWFTRLMVAATLIELLEKLDLRFPTLDGVSLRQLQEARVALLQGSGERKKAEADL